MGRTPVKQLLLHQRVRCRINRINNVCIPRCGAIDSILETRLHLFLYDFHSLVDFGKFHIIANDDELCIFTTYKAGTLRESLA